MESIIEEHNSENIITENKTEFSDQIKISEQVEFIKHSEFFKQMENSEQTKSSEQLGNTDQIENSTQTETESESTKAPKIKKKIVKSYYVIELIDMASSTSIINKFMSLHPEFFKTNINKKILNIKNNQICTVYTERVLFRDTIHKVSGYIVTELNDGKFVMKIYINKTNKNRECYIKQIEKYVAHQTKYGNNVELYYYKILSDTIIKHCYYNEPVENWAKDVISIENEFFSPHKQYLFSIIANKAKNSGIGNISNSWNNMILHGVPGCGKCFAKDTKILMYDGTIRNVQDIEVGEKVMGDDSTPRTVLSLSSGKDTMYKITHANGDSYVVNSNHVLSLVFRQQKRIFHVPEEKQYYVQWFDNSAFRLRKKYFGYNRTLNIQEAYQCAEIMYTYISENLFVDIPIRDYLDLPNNIKENLHGYRREIVFPYETVLDAYEIGLNIGNGISNCIPREYKFNSRNNRLLLLAGIVDACGTYIYITNHFLMNIRDNVLMDEIIFLCRSLGFIVTSISSTISVTGQRLYEVPSYIHIISTITNNGLDYEAESITVTPLNKDNFYGFEVDGNHRFLLENCIVAHNSSMTYRISMMLKLSILSVDLSLYLNKKKDLYALFHGQEFCLPNSSEKQTSISNAIIVLEEFDYAVDKLLDVENIFKYKDVIKREYLNMKNKEIKTRTHELVTQYVDDKNFDRENKNWEEKLEQLSNKQATFEDFQKMEMLRDGFDTENNRVFEKAQKAVFKKRDFDNEITGINAELNNIIKSMDDDNKSNILRLSDLLELFQGPVNIKNRIIIATTNNFEKIQIALPALFRSGRMSPIHFDYLDWESLNQLTLYYFGQRIEEPSFAINIPTSQIIELAIKYVLVKMSFDDFIKELRSLNKV